MRHAAWAAASFAYDSGELDSWDFDILRQGGTDFWMLLCAIAASFAAVRVVAGRFRKDLPFAVPAALAALGTALVLAIPPLHTPRVGLVWTWVCLSLSAAVFYRTILRQVGLLRGAIMLAMRISVIGLLVLMLFEPVIRYSAVRSPDRPLYLLVDASGSMSVPDIQNGPTRLQSVWQAIQPYVPQLQRRYKLNVRTFAGDVKALPSAADLAGAIPDGQSTDIVKAVGSVLNETDRPDAVVVLVSDGIDNTSSDVVKAIASSLRPINTLLVGSEQTQSTAVQNIAVESVESDEELSVGHEARLGVLVRSSGLANRVVDLKWSMLGEDGKATGETKSQKLVLTPAPAGQTIEIPFTPRVAGLQRLAFWIDPVPGERTTVDNRQEFQALALDPRVKVLYVEGRARPEYRELKRALDRDASIEAASLLRIQADRFAASGDVDGKKISGMPVGRDQWRQYDVIILGDLDASFLTKAQQAAIEQAVSEGSGLLMIGGQSSFGPGSYAGTAIEKALPVFTGGTDAMQERSEFVPRLTRQGALHPSMEGLEEWFGVEETKAARDLKPIRGNVVVDKPKSGASVLLVHQGRPGPDGQPQIVLAVQNYGKGRSAAFTADTTYLWYLPLRGMGQDSPYNRFWGQLVRWLAGADVKNRQQGAGLQGMLSRSVYQLGEAVSVKAMVRDERGDATRYATVVMELSRVDGKDVERANLSPVESRNGLYEMRIPQVGAGDWQIKLIATKDEKTLGQQTLKFTVLAPAEELTDLAARPQVMSEIAQKTKGFSYSLGQFSQLVSQLTGADSGDDNAPVRHVIVPLANAFRVLPALLGRPAHWETRYDLPMQAVLIVGILLGEWMLRRRWQLT